MIRLGLTLGTNDSGNLTDSLLVIALHDDRVGIRNLELDTLGSRNVDGVRVTKVENEVATLQSNSVTDTNDLQRLGVAGGKGK